MSCPATCPAPTCANMLQHLTAASVIQKNLPSFKPMEAGVNSFLMCLGGWQLLQAGMGPQLLQALFPSRVSVLLFVSFGSLGFCHLLVQPAMQVSEVIALTYRDGPQVYLPDSLVLHGDDGEKFLKLRASNHIITRLVLGHMPAYKEVKNPSLAASPQLKAIQEKIKEAVGISVSAMEAEGPDPFEDEKTESVEKDEKGPKKNEYKDKLLKAPPKVSVQLGSHAVELKTPKSWKETDILVPLDPASLTKVCDFIMENIDECLTKGNKRSYVKSGTHTKKPRLDESD